MTKEVKELNSLLGSARNHVKVLEDELRRKHIAHSDAIERANKAEAILDIIKSAFKAA